MKIWTSPEPARRVAVLSFQPGNLDVRKLSTALYQKDRIGCATRGGQDRAGLRFSPHFYNTHADVDATIAAAQKCTHPPASEPVRTGIYRRHPDRRTALQGGLQPAGLPFRWLRLRRSSKSLKFNTVLNSMLNSPKFCQR